MIERIEISIRRLRNYYSRSKLLVRLFGLSRFEERAFRKGLVIIQVDALSRMQLEKAVKAGEVPFWRIYFKDSIIGYILIIPACPAIQPRFRWNYFTV
jgi:hypothetical protein